VDVDLVPLHEAALEGEASNRINVVRLDDHEDDVIRAEDAQRVDADAELLGELWNLAGASFSICLVWALEVGQRSGGCSAMTANVDMTDHCSFSRWEARVAAAYFANLSSSHTMRT
jgi:hypothetical protein